VTSAKPRLPGKSAGVIGVVSSDLLGITVIIMADALIVNVLHVVDLELEARGEKSMRQMIWQSLEWKSKTPTKPKDGVSLAPDAADSAERSKHKSDENHPSDTRPKTPL
jgi:hypothetical protein